MVADLTWVSMNQEESPSDGRPKKTHVASGVCVLQLQAVEWQCGSCSAKSLQVHMAGGSC